MKHPNRSRSIGPTKNPPDYDDGNNWIPIPVLDALPRTRMVPSDYNILDVVIRYSCTFPYTPAKISLQKFADMTQLDNRGIRRSIKRLVDRNIIIRSVGNSAKGEASSYGVNERVSEWKPWEPSE